MELKVKIIKLEHMKSAKFHCFDDKIYIQKNGYDGLALGYQSSTEENSYLITIFKKILSSILF